jgi:hypothetical protein
LRSDFFIGVINPAASPGQKVMAFIGVVQLERNQQLLPVDVGSVLREADTLVVEPDG